MATKKKTAKKKAAKKAVKKKAPAKKAAKKAPAKKAKASTSTPKSDPKADPKPKTTITCRAKKPGFYRGARIRQGQTFELIQGDKVGAWMEPLQGKHKPDVDLNEAQHVRASGKDIPQPKGKAAAPD